MNKPNYVLLNNNKFADYIIELWKSGDKIFYYDYSAAWFIFPPSSQTIAIFKIRLK